MVNSPYASHKAYTFNTAPTSPVSDRFLPSPSSSSFHKLHTAASLLGVTPTRFEGHEIDVKAALFIEIQNVADTLALFWFSEQGRRAIGVLLASWIKQKFIYKRLGA
jgi:hypothetical protein